jgi:EAL and modified HD-GYP domain-containing signal transduction protein
VLARIDGKPPEPTATALVGAPFCELAGKQLPGPRPGELCTLGLFSVIDALIDASLEDVIALIPLPADMREALVCGVGEKGSLPRLGVSARVRPFRSRADAGPRSRQAVRSGVIWTDDAAGPVFHQMATAHPRTA